MRGKHLAVPAIALSLVTIGFVDSAEASSRARTTVTIKASGTGLYGKVKSPKPAKCAAGRTVYLILQIGRRGGGNDFLYATDTASWRNGAYRWNLSLVKEGKYYAKVARTPNCKPDKSRTVLTDADN